MTKDNLFNQLKDVWQHINDDTQLYNLPLSLLETLPSLPIAESNHSIITIYNLRTVKPEFFSENCLDILGYPREVPMSDNALFFLNYMSPEHQKAIIIQSQWIINCLSEIPFEEKVNIRVVYCGMRFYHPLKKYISLLFHHTYFEVNEDRNPLRTFITITDVSHLLKNETIWCRMQYGDKVVKTKTYDFETGIASNDDIISKREKEVLNLIAQGKDTVEIAKELFISVNTVNNHRQNMLNRLNVKDTTALVQLCYSCGIIK